jgi:hypothetical protein
VIGLWFERCLPIAFQRACSDTIMTNSARRLISGDGLLSARFAALPLPREWGNRPIDRSMSIVVETAQNSNRANFPLKSKAKKFDGLAVGFRPSAENFAY